MSDLVERLTEASAYGVTAEVRILAQLAKTEIERLRGLAQTCEPPVAWMNSEHIEACRAEKRHGIAWAAPDKSDFYNVPLYSAPQPLGVAQTKGARGESVQIELDSCKHAVATIENNRTGSRTQDLNYAFYRGKVEGLELAIDAFAQAVPDGWTLVPTEPTKEMIQASIWALDRWREKHGNVQGFVPPGEKYQIRWRAMLAAVPSVSSTARGGEAL